MLAGVTSQGRCEDGVRHITDHHKIDKDGCDR